MAGNCLTTVWRGFLVAFLTGIGVGIIRLLFASGITQEMANRGAPGVLDLAIAFFSGVVAGYAFGRPQLLSVLPGIAIATSLIPPVATIALSSCAFEFSVALGATLLFLSNFVAIVLGSAISFWFVGMRGPQQNCRYTTWARRWVFGFFFAATCLALYFTVQTAQHAMSTAVDVARADPQGQLPIDSSSARSTQKDHETAPLDTPSKETSNSTRKPVRRLLPEPPRSRRKRHVVRRVQVPISETTQETRNAFLRSPSKETDANEHGSGEKLAEQSQSKPFARAFEWISKKQQKEEGEEEEPPNFFVIIQRYVTQSFADDPEQPM